MYALLVFVAKSDTVDYFYLTHLLLAGAGSSICLDTTISNVNVSSMLTDKTLSQNE